MVSEDKGNLIKTQIKKYFKFWYLFVLGLVISSLVAFMYLRYTPKTYKSVARIKVLDKGKGLQLPTSAFVFNSSNINLQNDIQIIKSLRILEKVADSLDLTVRMVEEGSIKNTVINKFPFEFKKKIANASIKGQLNYKIVIDPSGFKVFKGSSEDYLLIPQHNSQMMEHNLPFEIYFPSPLRVEPHMDKVYYLSLLPITQVASRIDRRLSVSPIGKGSDLLQLSLTGENKQMTKTILNKIVEVFNQDGIEDRRGVYKRTIEFIDERFKDLANELDSIESKKQNYKKDNQFLTIESDAAIKTGVKTATDQEIFKIESEIAIIGYYNELLSELDSGSYEAIPSNIGLGNQSTNALINEYNSLIRDYTFFKTTAGENNPSLNAIETSLNLLKTNILGSLKNYKTQLELSKAQVNERNRDFKGEVSTLSTKEKILRSIERQQSIKETLYLFLLQKKEEAAINLAITEPSIKVVEYALSSGGAIAPNSKNIYTVALLLGLVIPFGFIYVLEILDTKVKGRADINALGIDVPVIGELPKIKGQMRLFDNPNDHSVQAEAFRILSSNTDYILPVTQEESGKVIYCTSTIKGEGKTYVSLNLSLALSSLNKKVLLIGADLRNPQIHNYIQKDKNHIGLSNYLHELNFSWRDALISGFEKHPNHRILLSGSLPPNPAHLLTNGRFKALIEEAKSEYDYIVVDTAPTILVTDTMLISQLADATIYITRANFTEKNLLNYSKELYDAGKLKNMAYVVNSVGASKSYGYSYNYGYNYGYGSKS